MEAQLLAAGMGAYARGSTGSIVGRVIVPSEYVNVELFLGSIAACAAKKIATTIPAIERIVVIVKAYGTPEAGMQRLAIEIYYDSRKELAREELESAAWSCPIMSFLRDKIESLTFEKTELAPAQKASPAGQRG